MEKKITNEIKITIIVGIILLLLTGTIIFFSAKQINNEITYEQCCGGNPCSDTYYIAKDNTCHLTLCENVPFNNKKNCVYQGANITMNFSNNEKEVKQNVERKS